MSAVCGCMCAWAS